MTAHNHRPRMSWAIAIIYSFEHSDAIIFDIDIDLAQRADASPVALDVAMAYRELSAMRYRSHRWSCARFSGNDYAHWSVVPMLTDTIDGRQL